jgi:hypothetical protein
MLLLDVVVGIGVVGNMISALRCQILVSAKGEGIAGQRSL